MNVVFGVLMLWIGGALIWVARHGLDSGDSSALAVWQQILAGIGGHSE